MFFASKKYREVQEKIHRLASSTLKVPNRGRGRLDRGKSIPQSIALSRKGQDVGVVNQAIRQRCRQAVVPKHPIPLSKF